MAAPLLRPPAKKPLLCAASGRILFRSAYPFASILTQSRMKYKNSRSRNAAAVGHIAFWRVLAGAVRAAPGQRYHSSRYPRTIFFISLKMISRRAVVVKHCSEALQPVLLDSVR